MGVAFLDLEAFVPPVVFPSSVLLPLAWLH